MQIEFICFLSVDSSSTCHSRDIQLLVTEILPVFVTLFVFEGGTVCWKLTHFCAMPYPYQITIKIIQRYCSYILLMLELKLSQNMVLVNCLNMTCQNDNVRKGNMSTVAPPGVF